MLDINGHEIKPQQRLIDKYNNQYDSIIDEHLGLSIVNVETGTIEKLFPEVAKLLQIAAIIWVDPETLIP